MQLSFHPLSLTKRHALTISRGTSVSSENLVVEIVHDGITGLGEMGPSGVTGDTPENAAAALERWRAPLEPLEPWERQRIEAVLDTDTDRPEGIGGAGGTAIRAALDMACWDWLGKRAGLPVWRLLGLDPSRIPETSVTVGINPPERAAEITRDWRERTGARVFKIKLGSPAGIDADQAMLAAVQQAAGPDAILRVDANGGWSVGDARTMLAWLAARGVEYVEQPLPAGFEEELAALHPSPLPLFVDETIHVASDVPKVVGKVEGVNLKVMKSGGISEGLRVIRTARAHGLLVMIGCMSESSLAISAGAQLAPLCDHIDLDSHLNLIADPFVGAQWVDGRIVPTDLPGLGVTSC